VYETAERITKSYLIGSDRFWSICTDNFKMRNLYAKNILFACSLPTSTSTWHSEHRNGPGGYMSGELKSENIKYRTAPTQRSHHPAKDPQSSQSYTTKSQKDISTLYSTILQYSKDPQDLQPRPSSINKTLTDCCSHLNAITIDDLECSLR
jgi:hypothetical protein